MLSLSVAQRCSTTLKGYTRAYKPASECVPHAWCAKHGCGLFAALQAKLVATATGNLCEAANLVVGGQASEEKLIAAAKAVASSTAQLLLACQVKADARSDSNRRLQVCMYIRTYVHMYSMYVGHSSVLSNAILYT